jgi:hypothetical protein
MGLVPEGHVRAGDVAGESFEVDDALAGTFSSGSSVRVGAMSCQWLPRGVPTDVSCVVA